MSDDLVFAILMIGLGLLAATYGSIVLLRARRTGVVRLLGMQVQDRSWTTYQAVIASTVVVTVVGFVSSLLGAGILMALSGPK